MTGFEPQLELLSEPVSPAGDVQRSFSTQEFLIPVHQFVEYSEREVEIIDHPAFQRLFEIQQLGQTNLVFRGATHKRGEHSLGTVETVSMLVSAIAKNCERRHDQRSGWEIGPPINHLEEGFVRLSALLHDIGHLAAGHTIEDELGLLPAHDEDERLNMVLDRDTWGGRRLGDSPIGETLRQRIDRLYGSDADAVGLRVVDSSMTASEILLQIISKDAESVEADEYLSDFEFRVGVLRDLVGNTLCADLLDYLHRDWHYIGKPRFFDERLLHYVEVRSRQDETSKASESQVVVNLESGKPGRYRSDAVTAILDVLEGRYQLWEVALLHRTKTGAASMMERAIAELAADLGYFGEDEALQSELEGEILETIFEATDRDLYRLLSRDLSTTPLGPRLEGKGSSVADDLLWRLSQRVLHKQIGFFSTRDPEIARSVSRRLAPSKESANGAVTKSIRLQAARYRLESLRQLELDFSIEPGSLTMYCSPFGMGRKLAEVKVLHGGNVTELHKLDSHDMISGGHLGAQLKRFDGLWRAALFASPETVDKLIANDLQELMEQAFKIAVLGDQTSGSMRSVAESLSIREGTDNHGRQVMKTAAVSARAGESMAYPSGVETIRSFIE